LFEYLRVTRLEIIVQFIGSKLVAALIEMSQPDPIERVRLERIAAQFQPQAIDSIFNAGCLELSDKIRLELVIELAGPVDDNQTSIF